MKKKTGSACSLVAPIAPIAVIEAINDAAGELAAVRSAAAPPRPTTPPPRSFRPPETAAEQQERTAWIEIELVDEDDQPVPGARYAITLPDGSVADGTLDAKGFARVEGFEPGSCQVTFPDLDQEAWEKL